jgi:hypothetical protein
MLSTTEMWRMIHTTRTKTARLWMVEAGKEKGLTT